MPSPPTWTTRRSCCAASGRPCRAGCGCCNTATSRLPPPCAANRPAPCSPCAARRACRSIINDDLQLALEIGADGAHLGREDGDLAAARAALGPGKLLGISCYDDIGRAREAKRVGADYVAFGSFFASPTKPAAVRAPLTLLGAAKAGLGLPVCAIGGITLQNAPQLIAAGADLLAVITDLFEAPDIRARAAAYTSLFSERVTP